MVSLISPGDDLVARVTLYKQRPWWLHVGLGPFFMLYAVWAYLWIAYFGTENHLEPGIIALAFLALSQILFNLSCYWSVHVLAFSTCNKVNRPEDADLVKVVPTANNGSSEMVRLLKRKDEFYWMFQKLKFIWDRDKKLFRGVEFPADKSYRQYLDWKGWESDEDLAKTEAEYGNNS